MAQRTIIYPHWSKSRTSKTGAITRSTAWLGPKLFCTHSGSGLKLNLKNQVEKNINHETKTGVPYGLVGYSRKGRDPKEGDQPPAHAMVRYVSPGCCCRYVYGDTAVQT